MKLTKDQVQQILQNKPQGTSDLQILTEMTNRGFEFEGVDMNAARQFAAQQNIQKPVETPKRTTMEKVATGAKAFLGGVASGVGGAVLTAEDYLARKAVGALPEGTTIAGVSKEQMQANLANAPKLQDQLKQQFGGNENPTAFGVGQLGGEIATLAAPVGAIGKATQSATKALGAKPIVSKLAQAGAEGIAFTAGQSAIEGEKQSLKDYAINAGLNMVFPAAGAVAKKVGETAPARIINSLIKPLQKDFAYGKNPGKTVAELGITANDFDGLIAGIKNAKASVGENIGTLTQKALPQLQSQMDLNTYLSPIDEALAIANKSPRTNATVISRLESVKADLVDNINQGVDPQSFKGLVGDLTRWTGNVSDDAIVNKALKQVYGKTASGMDTVLKDTLTPDEFAQYKKSAEQYGNLISAENAARYRDNIVKRADLVSFGAKNSALIAALGTAVASGGSGLTTILAGLGGAAVDKAMATPAFKTRLASLLSKLAPKEVQTFFEKVPTAKALYKQEQLDNLIKQAKKNLKNPSNAQGGFINLGGKNIEGLLRKQTELDLISTEKSNNLRKFAGNNGLIPDSVKNNPEYIKANNESKIALQNLQKFNQSSDGKLLQSEIRKLGVVERQKLRKSITQDLASPKMSSLEQEAKKYKSAEEFTTNSTELTYKNLQENPYSIKAYGKDFNEPVEYYRAGAIRKNGDIWLTDNQAGAQQYSSAGGGTKVGSYIVNSKKPLIIDTAGGKYAKGNIDINKILTKEEIAKGYTNNPDIKQKFIDYAKNNGYDAVQFADSFPDGEGGMRSLVVWDKNKIKTKSQLEEIWKKANNKK